MVVPVGLISLTPPDFGYLLLQKDIGLLPANRLSNLPTALLCILRLFFSHLQESQIEHIAAQQHIKSIKKRNYGMGN